MYIIERRVDEAHPFRKPHQQMPINDSPAAALTSAALSEKQSRETRSYAYSRSTKHAKTLFACSKDLIQSENLVRGSATRTKTILAIFQL